MRKLLAFVTESDVWPQSVSVSLKWYDLWIGAYWDRRRRVLYVCPLPCVCVSFGFKMLTPCTRPSIDPLKAWHDQVDTDLQRIVDHVKSLPKRSSTPPTLRSTKFEKPN